MKITSKNPQGLFFIVLIILCHNLTASAAVVPSGQTVGIKLYSDGLIVTATADFTAEDGKSLCPARTAGIEAGDVLLSANGERLTSSEQLKAAADSGSITLEVLRNGETETKIVTPTPDENGAYRIGAWVRDSTAGIGTLTCFDPETMRYSALGHSITDVDTGNIMTPECGNIQECEILSVKHGYIGAPGYVTADFSGANIGNIEENSEHGISGILNTAVSENAAVETAVFDEIFDGYAEILTDVCSNGTAAYSVSIKKLNADDTKNMIIEITDDRLLNATGGIIQGMSGAPVMQNGKLIGAVTHVFVNDPKKGYAIAAENFVF